MTSKPRALVVVAHPDDETFGLGSTIASLVDAGAEVVVCCATRGEEGEADGLPDDADLGAVREAELRAAGALLGVSRFVLLGYGDSGMTGELPAGCLAAAPLQQVVDDVRRVVAEVEPDLVVTLDADHGDGHRDHVQIGRATIEACRDRPDLRVYFWVIPREWMRQWFQETAIADPAGGHAALDIDVAGLVGRRKRSRPTSTPRASARCESAPWLRTRARSRRWTSCRRR